MRESPQQGCLAALIEHGPGYEYCDNTCESGLKVSQSEVNGDENLIGYDGSPCADAALDDLRQAGLPAKAEAHILSVAEVWLRLLHHPLTRS